MKDVYGNKMMKDFDNKKIAKYIGGFEIWIPSLKKKIKPGELVSDFPIDEAAQREDFILVKDY